MEAYAFLQVAMLSKVLVKLKNNLCQLIFIAPWWPRRPWFTELLGWLRVIPIISPDTAERPSGPLEPEHIWTGGMAIVKQKLRQRLFKGDCEAHLLGYQTSKVWSMRPNINAL